MSTPQTKLSDVARRAGVSTATVSRALSTPAKVSGDLLARVLAAVRETGYVPHGAARALRSRRTRTIGAVIPTLTTRSSPAPTHALQKSLNAAGYNLMLACHEFDPANETTIVQSLIGRGIDGVVLVGLDHEPALFEMLDQFRIPYLLTWAIDPEGRHSCVGFRNREAAARVAGYLHDMGHRRFAMIAGETAHNDRARERLAGVREALAARGIGPDALLVLETPYTFDAGSQALHTLAASQPRPTAIICGNDVLAIGAIGEARTLRLRVPQDLSIVGFDDLPISSLITPALTTVRVPTREMGETAAVHLLSRIAGETANAVRELVVELIVRDSAGPPGQGSA
ncbi:MAG: LacI family DNA-binding transcriptional regulator [Lautropia sp.]